MEPGPSIGQYRVLGPLGEGGQGALYRVRHAALGTEHALKLLAARDPGARGRFLQEARVLAGLAHEHLPRVTDAGEHEAGCFLVMDLIRGRDLRAHLAARGPFPLGEAVRIVGAVARALEHAHARGIVHRDVKPGNVLLEEPSGRPVLIDFGLARRDATRFEAATLDALGQLTLEGTIVGTPAYMAPEQVDPARGQVGPRTDVYALGGTLFSLLTGGPPFQASGPAGYVREVLEGVPPDLCALRPDVPPAVGALVAAALSKSPGGRPGSAAGFALALEAAAGPRGPSGRARAGEEATVLAPRALEPPGERGRTVAGGLPPRPSGPSDGDATRVAPSRPAPVDAEAPTVAGPSADRAGGARPPAPPPDAGGFASHVTFGPGAAAERGGSARGAPAGQPAPVAAPRSRVPVLLAALGALVLGGLGLALRPRATPADDEPGGRVRGPGAASPADPTAARLAEAQAAWRRGDVALAVAGADEVLRGGATGPVAWAAHLVRAQALGLDVESDAARAALRAAAAAATDEGQRALVAGIEHVYADRHIEAVRALDRAVALRPDDPDAWAWRGLASFHARDHAGARRDLDRALGLWPAHGVAQGNRGFVRADLGDLAGARSDLDRVVELAPRAARGYLARAGVRRALGDAPGALADYDRALELDPALCPALRGRGALRAALGDRQGALADYERARDLTPHGTLDGAELERVVEELRANSGE